MHSVGVFFVGFVFGAVTFGSLAVWKINKLEAVIARLKSAAGRIEGAIEKELS
jgi:hypothetical protein